MLLLPTECLLDNVVVIRVLNCVTCAKLFTALGPQTSCLQCVPRYCSRTKPCPVCEFLTTKDCDTWDTKKAKSGFYSYCKTKKVPSPGFYWFGVRSESPEFFGNFRCGL